MEVSAILDEEPRIENAGSRCKGDLSADTTSHSAAQSARVLPVLGPAGRNQPQGTVIKDADKQLRRPAQASTGDA